MVCKIFSNQSSVLSLLRLKVFSLSYQTLMKLPNVLQTLCLNKNIEVKLNHFIGAHLEIVVRAATNGY